MGRLNKSLSCDTRHIYQVRCHDNHGTQCHKLCILVFAHSHSGHLDTRLRIVRLVYIQYTEDKRFHGIHIRYIFCIADDIYDRPVYWLMPEEHHRLAGQSNRNSSHLKVLIIMLIFNVNVEMQFLHNEFFNVTYNILTKITGIINYLYSLGLLKGEASVWNFERFGKFFEKNSKSAPKTFCANYFYTRNYGSGFSNFLKKVSGNFSFIR